MLSDRLRDRLLGVTGAATVNVNGALRREWSVLLHAQKLREYGFSVNEVVAALRTQNATAPVDNARGRLEHQSIRLAQLATVEDGFAELTSQSVRTGNLSVGPSEGVDRGEALMAAGRKGLRPILMTTFALIASMLPVAIIGGSITRTLLTLLVVPSFDGSFETTLDRALTKFRRRGAGWRVVLAHFAGGWAVARKRPEAGNVSTERGSPLSGMPRRLLECGQRPSKECLHAVLPPHLGPCNRR